MTDSEFRESVLTTLARLDERTKPLELLPLRVDALERWRDRAVGIYIGVSTVVTLVIGGLAWMLQMFVPPKP